MTYHFFLGGCDLEMLEIRKLLERQGLPYVDHGRSWGVTLSNYKTELSALPPYAIPVTIEIKDDISGDWPMRQKLITIDHHGPRVVERCSLRQVFDLLKLPEEQWSRHYQLVAANDVGHVSAMRKFGATQGEMVTIRAADRQAQGITEAQEELGIRALRHATRLHGTTIAELPHDKTACVADPLALDPNFAELPRPLLVTTSNEINYYGPMNIAAALHARWPDGWFGGNPPDTGFWGVSRDRNTVKSMLPAVLGVLADHHKIQ